MAKVNFSTFNNLKSTSRKKMENAFNIIYKEYSYLIFYVALKIVKDNDLAHEITNETFMKFFINKDLIDGHKNIKYYLVTTAKNLSLNHIKKQERIVELHDNFSYEINVSNDFNNYIDKFKDFLNEEELELIIYHLLYDFTFKEIAKEKHTSINVISSKYQRAILKVKKHYKGE